MDHKQSIEVNIEEVKREDIAKAIERVIKQSKGNTPDAVIIDTVTHEIMSLLAVERGRGEIKGLTTAIERLEFIDIVTNALEGRKLEIAEELS